jgi:hypothetical protein
VLFAFQRPDASTAALPKEIPVVLSAAGAESRSTEAFRKCNSAFKSKSAIIDLRIGLRVHRGDRPPDQYYSRSASSYPARMLFRPAWHVWDLATSRVP